MFVDFKETPNQRLEKDKTAVLAKLARRCFSAEALDRQLLTELAGKGKCYETETSLSDRPLFLLRPVVWRRRSPTE
jgi:hypothetical protein